MIKIMWEKLPRMIYKEKRKLLGAKLNIASSFVLCLKLVEAKNASAA
jgi:hypothetical protein